MPLNKELRMYRFPLSLSCYALLLATSSTSRVASAFLVASPTPCTRKPSLLKTEPQDSNHDLEKSQNDVAGFNPFNYNQGGLGKTASLTSFNNAATTARISLRQTTMKELINELMSTDGSENAMQPILLDYQDFLLEPLEDVNAVQDPNSIYAPSMTRNERYEAYRASMEERIQQARHPQAEKALVAMKDFVLKFE